MAPEHAARTVTLMAPSKTYNVPGLGTSFAIIPDAALRAHFVRATHGIVAEVTCLGYTACEAAYRDSEDWRQDLLATLRSHAAIFRRLSARGSLKTCNSGRLWKPPIWLG